MLWHDITESSEKGKGCDVKGWQCCSEEFVLVCSVYLLPSKLHEALAFLYGNSRQKIHQQLFAKGNHLRP